MRTGSLNLLITAAAVALLWLARLHIRVLAETARTYATFRRLELELYTYPRTAEQDVVSTDVEQLTPKILHQIYLTEGRASTLERYQAGRDSCRLLHPGWQHMLWTDTNATSFVSDHYTDLLPLFTGYGATIQRADMLRYLLLHHHGGVFLDLDITCLVPLDEHLHLPWLTTGAYPAGINNAFMLSRPQHPFLTYLIEQVLRHNLKWPLPYVEGMLSIGCGFLGNAFVRYMRGKSLRAPEDTVYVLADGDGKLESQMLRGAVVTPLFEHGGASSWHGWDAAGIAFVGRHYVLALVLFCFGMIAAVWVVWCSASRQRARGQKSWEDEERPLAKPDGELLDRAISAKLLWKSF